MNYTAILFQLVQNMMLLFAAPLLLGWINQCRAMLQNRSGAGVLQLRAEGAQACGPAGPGI